MLNKKSPEPVRPFQAKTIVTGFGLMTAFLCSFAIWSYFAPLSSAVIAPGVVSVASFRKNIQHLEGGIIEKILVKSGDVVKQNQLLVKLKNVTATTLVNRLTAEYYEALSAQARLEAERIGAPTITFPAALTGKNQTATMRGAMQGQIHVFDSRRKLFADRLSILNKQILQLQEEIKGLEGQTAATKKQYGLLTTQMSKWQQLRKKKLITDQRLAKTARQQAELEGQQSILFGKIAQTRQQILVLKLKMARMRTTAIDQVVSQLREQRANAYDIAQKLIKAQDILRRTEIRSPIEGTIVNLQVHTQGGVISPGQQLMEIVPLGDPLVVEVQIDPADIDEVKTGLPVNVELTSLTRRNRRPIKGILSIVSADRLSTAGTGQPFYRARVQLFPASVKQQQTALLAGMGATVFIQTGNRTALEYLFSPVIRTFQHGLREN